MYKNNSTSDSKIAPFIDDFFSTFKIGSIFHSCGAAKLRGISPLTVLKYLFSVIFTNHTMAHDQKVNAEAIKKDTCHRLLESSKIDWNMFLSKVASSIASILEPFRHKDCIGEKMPEFYVLDDSSFYRNRSKKTELIANCWDHALNRSYMGFRMLTLAWSDGKTALPLSFCNMSSTDNEDKDRDSALCFGNRIRNLSCKKMNDTMIELIKDAKAHGPNAEYVLCDRWFSDPKNIFAFLSQGLDAITMLKQNKTRYLFEGKEVTIKELFSILVKRDRIARKKERRNGNLNGRKWLYSAIVTLFERNGDGKKDVRIVFVQNRNKKSEFLAILSTDTELTQEQVIEYFGTRWSIEICFHTLKSYLRLQKTTQSIDYMQIHASTAIAMLQLQMLAYRRRLESDAVSYGALFLILIEEFSDSAMREALARLLSMFAGKIAKEFSIPMDSIMAMVDEFIKALPCDIKSCLKKENAAA